MRVESGGQVVVGKMDVPCDAQLAAVSVGLCGCGGLQEAAAGCADEIVHGERLIAVADDYGMFLVERITQQ